MAKLATHDPASFKVDEELGKGSYAVVHRVENIFNQKIYARKSIRRVRNVSWHNEVEILHRLKHRHIVELISSFCDDCRLELIMLPVADEDLSQFLQRFWNSPTPDLNAHLLKRWLGCLAVALSFLHNSKVRHKDIKPSNILIHDGNVLLADFGIARDFADAQFHTTDGNLRGTVLYCAPEVAAFGERNTAADIFSLGCVLTEMLTCVCGRTLHDFHQFRTAGEKPASYHAVLDRVRAWSFELQQLNHEADISNALMLSREMVLAEARDRPSAEVVAGNLTRFSTLSGNCCFNLL
jgi:serine/threonine protein kinase